MRTFVVRDKWELERAQAFVGKNWEAMARENKPLQITVAVYKAKRSLQANKRYRAILAQIADQAWVGGRQFSADVWHEEFKRRFIGAEDLPSGGTKALSSTELSTAEFNAFNERVEAFAATDLGIELEAYE